MTDQQILWKKGKEKNVLVYDAKKRNNYLQEVRGLTKTSLIKSKAEGNSCSRELTRKMTVNVILAAKEMLKICRVMSLYWGRPLHC